MSGEDLKRIMRAMVFLFVAVIILYLGMLPSDFSESSLQISPYFYSWTAAFMLRRPGSVNIVVIIIAAFFYLTYNDEGVALGALTYLLFGLLLQEFRENIEYQSFVVEVSAVTILFFLSQLFKNLILRLFFTHTLPFEDLLKSALFFAISYAVFAALVTLVFGRRLSGQTAAK